MAYKTLPPPGYPGSKLRVFYNLTEAVGPGKPNQQDDVMLVQLCLQQIYGPNTKSWYIPEGSPLAADGKFGPMTHNTIWEFQTQMEQNGVDIYPDGVVDQANDWRGKTATRYSYTMLWLNWCLVQVIGEKRFLRLDIDRITPRVLSVRLGISDF